MGNKNPVADEFLEKELDQEVLTDPASTNQRFYMLFLACMLNLGSYFSYDLPAALETQIIDVITTQQMNISIVQYNMFYSFYSFPNIIFPLFGGYLIDKFGAKFLIIASSLLITIGQAVFAFGVSINSFPIALLGRAIFGCGGDNLDIAQNIIIISWFTGKELSMAFGLNSAMALFGSSLNDNLEPFIVEKTNLNTGMLICFLACCISFLDTFFLNSLDGKRNKILGIKGKAEVPECERFRLKDVKEFSLLFWILLLNCVVIDASVYCFWYITSGFYQDRFGYNKVQSSSIMSIVFLVPMVCCPIIGIITDKYGKRTILLIIAALFLALFNLACMFTSDSYRPILPIFYLGLLGLGYSIHSTVFWSGLSYAVESKLLGTAYGITYSVSNMGLVIVPIFTGYLQDATTEENGYYWVNVTLGTLAMIGALTGTLIYFIDIGTGGILNSKDPEKALKDYTETQTNAESLATYQSFKLV